MCQLGWVRLGALGGGRVWKGKDAYSLERRTRRFALAISTSAKQSRECKACHVVCNGVADSTVCCQRARCRNVEQIPAGSQSGWTT